MCGKGLSKLNGFDQSLDMLRCTDQSEDMLRCTDQSEDMLRCTDESEDMLRCPDLSEYMLRCTYIDISEDMLHYEINNKYMLFSDKCSSFFFFFAAFNSMFSDNPHFGYGMINATAFALAAKTWVPVSSQVSTAHVMTSQLR